MATVSGLDLKVLNTSRRDSQPHLTAVFVAPYDRGQRIAVLYGGIVPFFKLDPEGIFDSGSLGVAWQIKDRQVQSAHDLQAQVDGYLSLLRQTEAEPTSVVLAQNPFDLRLGVLTDAVVSAYRHLAMERHRSTIQSVRESIVAQGHARCYDPTTPEGAARVASNKTMTSYVGGAAREVMEVATQLLNGKTLDKAAFVFSG